MNYSFDELVRKQCVYCLQFNPVDETCKVSGNKARNTCECNCFLPVRNEEKDAVNHPNHYTQGGIECVDAMKACVSGLNEMEAACTSHALKYLWRWKHKNGAEDIRKCIWWLERLLKEVDNE